MTNKLLDRADRDAGSLPTMARCARRAVLAAAVTLPAGLAGSVGAQDIEGTSRAERDSQVAPAQTALRPTIRSVTATGTLCTAGDVFTFTSDANANAHVMFGSQLIAERAAATGTCSIVIEVAVPAGYQFSRPRIEWREFFTSFEAPRGTSDVGYSFEGTNAAPLASKWTLVDDNDTLTTSTPDLWSPCVASNIVRFKAQLTVTLPPGTSQRSTSIYTPNNFDFMTAGAQWRRCGGA